MLNEVCVLSIGGSNDTTASNSILLPLNKRDRVWIELTQGKLVEPYHKQRDSHYHGPKKSGYTSFIGYLIGEISQEDISNTNEVGDFSGDEIYDDNYNQGDNHLSNEYPNEYYPSNEYPNEYYPSNDPNQNGNQLIIIDSQRFPINRNIKQRDNNRPRIVDHRFQNLTPNRRQDIKYSNQQHFETTTDHRFPNNRNRFRDSGDGSNRDDIFENKPISKIEFGKLPYPVGNANPDRST